MRFQKQIKPTESKEILTKRCSVNATDSANDNDKDFKKQQRNQQIHSTLRIYTSHPKMKKSTLNSKFQRFWLKMLTICANHVSIAFRVEPMAMSKGPGWTKAKPFSSRDDFGNSSSSSLFAGMHGHQTTQA